MTPRHPRLAGFTSLLAPRIDAYLRLKEALGCQYAAERTILRALDAFLTTVQDDLTADTFAAWNATLGTAHVGRPPQLVARRSQSLSVPATHGARRVCP
jgi:hypothetical protein